MPAWHNLVLRKPGNSLQDSLFPLGYPGSNPGAGVLFCFLKYLNQPVFLYDYDR